LLLGVVVCWIVVWTWEDVDTNLGVGKIVRNVVDWGAEVRGGYVGRSTVTKGGFAGESGVYLADGVVTDEDVATLFGAVGGGAGGFEVSHTKHMHTACIANYRVHRELTLCANLATQVLDYDSVRALMYSKEVKVLSQIGSAVTAGFGSVVSPVYFRIVPQVDVNYQNWGDQKRMRRHSLGEFVNFTQVDNYVDYVSGVWDYWAYAVRGRSWLNPCVLMTEKESLEILIWRQFRESIGVDRLSHYKAKVSPPHTQRALFAHTQLTLFLRRVITARRSSSVLGSTSRAGAAISTRCWIRRSWTSSRKLTTRTSLATARERAR